MLNIDLTGLFGGANWALNMASDSQAWLATLVAYGDHFAKWVEQAYRDSPALVFGVFVALALPAIATAGLISRILARSLSRSNVRPNFVENDERPTHAIVAGPGRQLARLEFSDRGGSGFDIVRDFTRIGRETDNDICLTDPTVHRYHAVIERSAEAQYFVSFVGDPDYDGLFIDGKAVRRQMLLGGEILQIGSIQLRFMLTPA